MAIPLSELHDDHPFLSERHLATLATLDATGMPHLVPVGFTWDAGARLARIITRSGSVKVANLTADPRAAICQLAGPNWLTLRGEATVSSDDGRVAEAVARYAARYRQPEPRDDRVVIEIAVRSAMGRLPPVSAT